MNHYLAFISYRHTGRDGVVAGVLRHGLESFHAGRKSALPRVRKVFRDTDELPTSADLGADIENALQGSNWLIALCSEEYVQSRWCLSEIRSFIALGRKDRILPVLVSGSPETAMPEEIRDLAPAADLRNRKDLKDAAADSIPYLLARMSGEAPDVLLGRHRRFRMALVAVGAAVLAAAILGFAAYATRTANVIADNNEKIEEATGEARAARDEAIQERNNALLNQAEYTALVCRNMLKEGDVDGAIRTALTGLPEDLHGEDPVSPDLLGVLQTAMCVRRPAVTLMKSVQLPFRVTDCSWSFSGWSDLMTLSGDGITALNLTDGTLEAPGSDLGERVLQRIEKGTATGRHHVICVNSQGDGVSLVFWEPGLPVMLESGECTVGGEPFAADHAVGSDGDRFLCWHGGETPAAAVFYSGSKEAVTLLQCDAEIVSAAFIDKKQVAAADATGKLTVYSTADGSVLFTPETTCRFVQYYYYSYPQLYIVTAEGSLCCADAANGEILWTASFPSPARSVDCNRKGKKILVVCDDGVRICSLDDGSVIKAFPETEGAFLAQWDINSNGTRFAAIREDRADVYEYRWEEDKNLTVSVTLTDPEMPYGSILGYSRDGKYVYLIRKGDIGKWDAETGALLWVNKSNWGDITANLTDTRSNIDGDAFWRQMYNGTGLEKIDAETGETLFSVEKMADSYFPMPKESPDRTKGLITKTGYGHEMVVLDTATGEKLWRKDLDETDRPSSYSAYFSEDSEQVWCMMIFINPDGFTRSMILRRYDAQNGTILHEDRIEDKNDPLYLQFQALPIGIPKNTDNTFMFFGEPAEAADTGIIGQESGALLLDAELVLSVSGQNTYYPKTAAAPDGSSICITSAQINNPALLIHPLETDELVEWARRREGGGAQ